MCTNFSQDTSYPSRSCIDLPLHFSVRNLLNFISTHNKYLGLNYTACVDSWTVAILKHFLQDINLGSTTLSNKTSGVSLSYSVNSFI
jgi:hypothetical protein